MNKPPRSKAQLQQWREMQEADDPTLENFSGWNEEKEQQKIDDLTHNTMIAAAALQTDNSEEKADIDYEDARILDKSLPEEPKAASKDPLAAAGEQRNSKEPPSLDADLDDFDVNASTAPAPSQLGYKAGELSNLSDVVCADVAHASFRNRRRSSLKAVAAVSRNVAPWSAVARDG